MHEAELLLLVSTNAPSDLVIVQSDNIVADPPSAHEEDTNPQSIQRVSQLEQSYETWGYGA